MDLIYVSLVCVALNLLAPKLLRIREKHEKDQRRMLEETAGSIRRGLADGGRFLWVKDLAMPDGLLALGCAVAGMSIYMLASGLVGVAQAVLVRRRAAHILTA